MYKSLSCCKLRSPNVLKNTNSISSSYSFSKTKLFIDNPIYCSCFSLNSFSQNFKYDLRRMWYQTNSPIVLAFCCVCLFSSEIITVWRKSLGHSPVVYICWHISINSSIAFSPRHFSISPEISSTPSAFPFFSSFNIVVILSFNKPKVILLWCCMDQHILPFLQL